MEELNGRMIACQILVTGLIATAQNAFITDNPQAISSVGNHPQGVPAYLANLWTTYKFSIAGTPGFMVGGGLNYQSITYSDITNVNSIPSYVIGNALLAYTTPRWSLSLNVKNITNERYFVAPTRPAPMSAIHLVPM
jgi:iron complex outermembrane recepter protein